MRVADFEFELPPGRIAQHPAPERTGSRLMVFRRPGGALQHRTFGELPRLLRPGDLLVLNDTRVLRARLRAEKAGGGGAVEMLLAEELGPNHWWVMLKPGRRVRPGVELRLRAADGGSTEIAATVMEKSVEGLCRVEFGGTPSILGELEHLGEVPLPPYIRRPAGASTPADVARYQTVFAERPGSVAAPTAGLHFTASLLAALRDRGVEIRRVTLHVGLGTFAPVKTERVEAHRLHAERFELPAETAAALNGARREGRRIVAVGTTVVRVLEHAGREGGAELQARCGQTDLFLHPPAEFRWVDALVTNFHLPGSTLLMLACAFAAPGSVDGRAPMLAAYESAVREGYRFFSYGDAMLIE